MGRGWGVRAPQQIKKGPPDWFGKRLKLLKQVKLVASELRASPPGKMKQLASPEALKQVKLVASEFRALPREKSNKWLHPKL